MRIEQTNSRISVEVAPADLGKWDNCHRQVAYEQIWRVQVAAPDAFTIFGGCVEQSVYGYLLETTRAQTPCGPIERFVMLWREALTEHAPHFRAREDRQSFERAGIKLMRLLPTFWKRTRWSIARAPGGSPIVRVPATLEWDFRFDHTPQLALELVGTLGLVVERPGLGRGLLEVATVRSPHSARFARYADQLTALQSLYEKNVEADLGANLKAVGFWDFIKTEADASIDAPLWVPPRSLAETAEFADRVDWMAQEVARNRFTRTSRWQWNTPCAHCAYARHCIDQDNTGLRFPAQPLIAA